MKNLHVLWVNTQASFRGGAEQYVHRTAGHLAARGVTSSLLYDVSDPGDPSFFRAFSGGAYPIVDAARQVAGLRPDVVYVHRVKDPALLGTLARTDAPVLRFLHDHRLFCLREHKYTAIGQRTCTKTTGLGCYACPGFVERRPDRSLGLRTLAALEREQEATRRLDGVVVGSRYMAAHVAAHGFDPRRVTVLPLYADGPAHPPSADREAGRLLFVGQLVRGKGLDVLLDALSRVSLPFRLDVAGDGAQAAELQAQAARLGLAGRVSFAGSRRGEDLERLYRRSSVLVVPSRTPETFALVGLEAMRHGLPVIAAAVGGMNEWLEHGRNGLFVPSGDAGALAAAIERLLGDPALAATMGEAGRARLATAFRAEDHVEGLVALFSSFARRRAA